MLWTGVIVKLEKRLKIYLKCYFQKAQAKVHIFEKILTDISEGQFYFTGGGTQWHYVSERRKSVCQTCSDTLQSVGKIRVRHIGGVYS